MNGLFIRNRNCCGTVLVTRLGTVAVIAGSAEPDLRLELGVPSTTNCPTIPTTVYNEGSAAASGVLVRYYAGNPGQGGTALHDEVITQSIAAGDNVALNVTIPNFPQNTSIQVWGVVDPDNSIAECNDGNNSDPADGKISCDGVN